MRTCFVLLLAAGLVGCAADVKRADALSPISTYADTRNRLLVNFQGDPGVTATPGWTRLTGAWRRMLQDDAASSDYQLGEQTGAVATTSVPATLLVVEVDRLRQEADGDGLGKGSLRVNVRFTDGPSGRLMGSRRYESDIAEPTSLEGQLKDISKAIIEEVEGAQRIAKRDPLPESPTPASAPAEQPARPAPAPAPGQSVASREAAAKPVVAVENQERQLQKLQRSNLPFDQYQNEYRRITAQ
ncbi:hypothetical protein [Pseudomonas sp. 273]|uniref:hypothetical protein n=1 Tax=Pseudomonas sp. 273 TaxID=75692 RepID=UPI0023D89016|nr:hypothetical protein [Pseudomonas sp. 273]